jgi:hypothetical protein
LNPQTEIEIQRGKLQNHGDSEIEIYKIMGIWNQNAKIVEFSQVCASVPGMWQRIGGF